MNFKNSSIKISYDFWHDNGNYTCTIENLTDSLIFLNMEMSHLIYNYFANPYYSSNTIVNSIKASTIIPETDPNINLTLGKSVAVTQDKIIIIPPRSRKNIPTFNLAFLYINCNLSMTKSYSMLTFNNQNTPVTFSNLMYFKTGEQSKWESFRNDFWVSSITNLSYHKFYDQKLEVICGRQTGYTTSYIPLKSKNRYFKTYRIK
jgi:hypothetical protein